ncbi:MAG: KEOPS complex kinase/ATPase Bud32 [archaeon]
MKEIDGGAEALIYEEQGQIIKDRISKSYRIPDIDVPLRKTRTKREATILERLPIPGPKLIRTEQTKLIMTKVPGKKLRDVLEQHLTLARRAGTYLAQLHSKGIIHGDLTTSNMLYDAETDTLTFIDFGLSSLSHKTEDKAVDLHLFRQALESKHTTVWESAFSLFLNGYKQLPGWEPVLERFVQVEARGRNKEKT